MSNTKQEIISELKNKLTQFKSKYKNNNLEDNTKGDDIINMEINMDTLKNYYKIPKENNTNIKENLNQIINNNNEINIDNDNITNNNSDSSKILKKYDNVKYNNYIKDSSLLNKNALHNNSNKDLLKLNSTSTSNFINSNNKNYLDFDIDEIIKQSKKQKKEKSDLNFTKERMDSNQHLKSKTFVNFDEININHHKKQSNLLNYNNNLSSRKNFIKLNLSSKKNISNTDRNYRFINNFNTDNLYEENLSEPNINKNDINNNYFKFQNKLTDFMNEIKLPNNDKNNFKNRFSLNRPIIKIDKSKYNLDFLINNDNKDNKENYYINKKNDKINKFNLKEILNYDIYNENEKVRSSSNKKNVSFYNLSKFNINNYSTNNLMKINNKTLSKFNYYNSNLYNLNSFENDKNNNLIYNDIRNLKYSIQNLSNEDINNLPLSVYKEIKELYNLLYIKFFKNN